jgi:1,4-dihydroxy-2-naphthoyl-CoA hydrolase
MTDAEERRARRYPGLLGMIVVERRHGFARAEMEIAERHLRPHIDGVHAGAVVSLADTACGVGCQASLDPGKTFITVELKANLIASASAGRVVAEAVPVHMGRRTHVWEARVTRDDGKIVALFTCTQLILDEGTSGDGSRV